MKRLIIVRHAKSSWDGPVRDFDRILEYRGIKDAEKVAQQTREFIPKDSCIVSSAAQRASQTAQIFARIYQIQHIEYRQDLYTFDEYELERVVRRLDDQFDCIILFGHNEAITNFVNKFGDVFIPNVATSGFTMLEFAADQWQKISTGKTLKVVFPKDLK